MTYNNKRRKRGGSSSTLDRIGKRRSSGGERGTRREEATLVIPRAPQNASPVPSLTSLHSSPKRGRYGDASFPGNCGGELIKDVLMYFAPQSVFDPMQGSGTCADVCEELGIAFESQDLKSGYDACNLDDYPDGQFDFVWSHPPYWRQKEYSNDPRDLSTAETLDEFLEMYFLVISNCVEVLKDGGHLAILMGNYSDRDEGFVPLVFHTQSICFELGLIQPCTEIIRFGHGASSSKKSYESSFIPGLHDVLTIFQKPSRTGGRRR